MPLKKIRKIAIRHLTKDATPNPNAAPKKFSVTNVETEENDNTRIIPKKKNFVFKEELGYQIFDYEVDASPTTFLTFDFHDNYGAEKGDKKYVSLFRLEVYGES